MVASTRHRDFARATGTLAKTDALDAAVLAHFAEAVRPPVRPLRDAETQALNALAARRHRSCWSRRRTALILETCLDALTCMHAVRPRIEAHIAWSVSWTTWQGLRQTLRQSPVCERKRTSCAGVGEQLLAYLPELGTLDAGRSPPGSGSLQPGQRHPAGQTHRMTRPNPRSLVHGSVGSQPPQPRDPGLLSAAAGGW